MKKKRQTDPHGGEDYSTESCDEKPSNGLGAGSSRDCTHIKKSVEPTRLRKNLKTVGIVSETCSDCVKSSKNQATLGAAPVSPATGGGGDDETADMFEYDRTLWLCLMCGSQLCGRSKNQHALKHFQTPRSDSHSVAMNTTTFEIWCYSCDDEVSPTQHKKLQECVEFVKKLLQKPPPAAAAIPLPPPPDHSIDAIQGKIAATLEHIRPLLPTEQTESTENNNGVVFGPSPPPPPPPPIPGMAKRVQMQPDISYEQPLYRPYPNEAAAYRNQYQFQLPRVRGLANLGNTCFFNAVMQCLAQTPFLLDVLKESSEPGEEFILPGGTFKFDKDGDVELPPIKGVLSSWGGLTSALAQTLEELQSGGGVYNPSKLFDKLCAKCPQFCGGDQHDSHELLRHLLESVRSDDLRRYQKVILQNIGYYDQDTNNANEEIMKKKCKIYGQQAGDRILRPEQVFRGFLVSTLRCQDCFHTSSRHENFLDMSLPVSVEKPQPPMRRRNSPENVPQGPSKHQLKKEKEKERKAKRAAKHAAKKQLNSTNSMETNSTSGSEQSDADVEDNLNDDSAAGTSGPKPQPVVLTCDPNGNSNELTSPLVPEKRGDSPENPNKDSLDDDENDSGIATSPANASGRFPEPKPNTDDPAAAIANNKEIEIGLSEKGANLVRQLSLTTNNSSNSILIGPSAAVNGGGGGGGVGVNNDSLTNELDKLHLTSETSAHDLDSPRTTVAANIKRAKAKRVRTQSYSDWSTTIAPRYQCEDGECSVQSCLNNFTAVELMTGNNKVGCDNCTKRINGEAGGKTIYTNATKQFLISSPPAVLILHLKRFQIGQRCIFRKLTWPVEFPMILDIAPFCGSKVKNLPNIDRKQKKLMYALYGVVEHSGSMYGGHYTAFVKVRPLLQPDDKRWKFIPQGSKAELDQADEQREKLEELLAKEKARDLRMKANDSDDFSTSCSSSEPEVDNEDEPEPSPVEEPENVMPPPGKWYYVSDSRVQEVTEDDVLKAQAYLLFYERIY